MTQVLQQAEAMLGRLTLDEKMYLLQRITNEISRSFPGVTHTPGVCGGAARIARTRIPVWVLEQGRRLGMTREQLLEFYPSLQPKDIAQAWAYAGQYGDEIDLAIRENDSDYESELP